MKKNKTAPFLERIEWDFTQIEDCKLDVAAMWEYGRTCKSVRKSTVDFLETAVDGTTIRQHLIQEDSSIYSVMTARLGELASSKKISKNAVGRMIELIEFIVENRRIDFPAPWITEKLKLQKMPALNAASRLAIHSLVREPNYCDKLIRAATAEHNFWSAGETFVMVIELDGKVEILISEFSKWVRKEAKKHPRKLGQPTQAQTYPLKCLSAYRLNQAGFTFSRAQEFIRKHNDGGRLIPVFADASGWTDALQYARRKIKNLASNPE